MKVKVLNMTSNNGNKIPNQFIIKSGKYVNSYLWTDTYFQSYETIIAQLSIKKCGNYELILDNNALNYSRTTSKYLYKFLLDYIYDWTKEPLNKKVIEKKIKEGKIKLKNLN